MKQEKQCGCGCSCGHNHEHEQKHTHEHGEHHGCSCGHEHQEHAAHGTGKQVIRFVLGAVPVIIGFYSFWPIYVTLPAALLAYALFGFEVWRDMIAGFRKKKIFTEFTLMCVASLGAFAIGEYADAAAVMYLYALGESISSGAYARSRRNFSELLEIAPEYAMLWREGTHVRVSPEEAEVGDRILVVAGERVPLDGMVLEGSGSADTSSVTGESMPLALTTGVSCPSGSVLLDGSVCLAVEKRYEHSVVAKLTAAVQEAQKKKSPTERKISRFAGIFTPLAFAIAITVAVLGGLLTGDVAQWIQTGLAVLVVSCPCSMVLSVPLTYFAGIGLGAKHGIIFRGGEAIDAMADMKAIFFDKTGTLTESQQRFEGVELYADMTEETFCELAYAVLRHSPHAAARSFCMERSDLSTYEVTEVRILGGRGVVCHVDGKQTLFGNAALLREYGIEMEDSKTGAIFGAIGGVVLGKLCFSSRLKSDAKESLLCLKKQGVSRMAVLSGDGEEAVRMTCDAAGIDECYAHLMPHEKLERFDLLYGEEKKAHPGATVAYCGDGLNDSAVIARADIGIAMGKSGSALTVTEADVVIMDDSLSGIPKAMTIARHTSSVAGQNIVLSVGIKAAVLVCGVVLTALTGRSIPLELAIIADVGAAVFAVLNALRASRLRR